jgi:hypothetical protein
MRTKMVRYAMALLVLNMMYFLTGCKDDDNNKPEPPRLVLLDAPQALVANVDTVYIYRVRLENASAESLFCNVTKPDGSPLEGFALYDDGGTVIRHYPSYADSFSGDIAAGNGTFTRRISGRELASGVTGTYRFRFSAAAQNVAEQIDVQLENVSSCLIVSVPSDTMLPACFTHYAGMVQISRSAEDRVDTVRATLQNGAVSPETSQLLIPASGGGDTMWVLECTPVFFRCRYNIETVFGIRIDARTHFGQSCSWTIPRFDYQITWPVVSQSTLPDTIFRPTAVGDTDTVVVTMHLDDCTLMGVTDYYGLQFDVRREDRTDWSHGGDFYFRDDGRAPDAIAGNGTYTVGLTFNRDDSLPDKLYYFRFYAVQFWGCAGTTADTTGRLSNLLLDSVRVIQPPPLLQGLQAPSGDFGVVR